MFMVIYTYKPKFNWSWLTETSFTAASWSQPSTLALMVMMDLVGSSSLLFSALSKSRDLVPCLLSSWLSSSKDNPRLWGNLGRVHANARKWWEL
jgi:hypothetical protein